MPPPFYFSIITPCLNRSEFIVEAIESVLAQNYPLMEHIIVDGGSTDGTLDILSRFPHLHVISEPDHGMYDAINKGIRAARGNIIGFLNSDDCYPPDTFISVEQCLRYSPDSEAVIGGALTFEDDPHVGRKTLNRIGPYEANDLFNRIMQGRGIMNAWFFKRELFNRVGFFTTEYRIAADSEMILRIGISGCSVKALQQVVYHYRHHPDSLTINSNVDRIVEPLSENVHICESFLNNSTITPPIRKNIRRWHTGDTLHLAYFYLKEKRFRDLLLIFKRGWSYDIKWPAVFAVRMCRRILAKFFSRIF
ncbi:MAG: glycosyltransferase family 2 protein [Anaerolineales bacterium]